MTIKRNLHISILSFLILGLLFLTSCSKTPRTGTQTTNTRLHNAAENGETLKVVYYLIQADNPNNFDANQFTPLHYAAKNDHTSIMTLLLWWGADKNAKGPHNTTPLHMAAEQGKNQAVRCLISHKADLNTKDYFDSYTPLHHAIRNKHVETAKILIDAGVSLNELSIYGESPIVIAVEENLPELVELLADKKADLYAGPYPAIDVAADCGSQNIVQILLDHGANVNEERYDGCTPLHEAVFNDDKPMAVFLIENGAKVNHQGQGMDTPLHLSCLRRNSEIIHLLLSNGADPNIRNDEGYTPIYYALFNENNSFLLPISYLNCRLSFAFNPKNGSANLDILVSGKARVNVSDNEGNTPLHYACYGEDPRGVDFLLKNGAKVNVKNKLGKTPLDVAREKKYKEIIHLLQATRIQ